MTGITGTRRLARAALLSITTLLLLLSGGTAAWAQLAPPDTGDATGPIRTSTATSSDASSTWELLLVAAVGAALAVGVTLLLVRMASSRRAGAAI